MSTIKPIKKLLELSSPTKFLKFDFQFYKKHFLFYHLYIS